MITLDFYTDAAGEARWRAKAENGRIVADSAEGYGNRQDASDGLWALLEAVLLHKMDIVYPEGWGPTSAVLAAEMNERLNSLNGLTPVAASPDSDPPEPDKVNTYEFIGPDGKIVTVHGTLEDMKEKINEYWPDPVEAGTKTIKVTQSEATDEDLSDS